MREARISFKCSSKFFKLSPYGNPRVIEGASSRTNKQRRDNSGALFCSPASRYIGFQRDRRALTGENKASHQKENRYSTRTARERRLNHRCVCVSKTRSTCGWRCVKMNDRVPEWNSPDICHHSSGRHAAECTSVRRQQGRARGYLAVCRFSPPFFPLMWESELLLLWVKWWVQLFGTTQRGNWKRR